MPRDRRGISSEKAKLASVIHSRGRTESQTGRPSLYPVSCLPLRSCFCLPPYSKCQRFDNRAEGRERNFSQLGSDLKINLKKSKRLSRKSASVRFPVCLHKAHKASPTANVSDLQKRINCPVGYLCCFKIQDLSFNSGRG